MRNYFEVADLLQLPIGDKVYTIPGLSIAAGVKLTALIDGTLKETPNDDEFLHMMLGTAYDEMLADEVPERAINLAWKTVMAEFKSNRETAEAFWESGGNPKAPDPSPVSTPSPNTGKAPTTRKRAATSGTNSPRK